MLGKLIKYEFKHTSKTMFTTFVVLAFATLMGSIALYQVDRGAGDKGTFLEIISAAMLVLYFIAIIGIYCVDFIYLCYHYHKTMYSSQGYLTHTLPVSPTAVFNVKILTAFIWMLASTALSTLSVLILLQAGSGGEFFRAFAEFAWDDFTRTVKDLFGISAGHLIFICILTTLLSILWYIMWVAASMAIGQLFQGSRMGFGILAGFCIYMINQIAGTAYMAVFSYPLNDLLNGNLKPFMNHVIGGSIGISAVLLVILYVICIYINKKRLNLE